MMPNICQPMIAILDRKDFISLLQLFRIIKPITFPIAIILPLYKLFASGMSSPVTIYNIEPAAKAKHIAITSSEAFPITLPKKAPYSCCHS